MILFVWSLVSSAIEAARKRHVTNFLRALLTQQRVTRNYEMLIWKKAKDRGRTTGIYRAASEPKLDSTLIFQTQLVQVFAEKFESLRVNEWRFSPSFWPTDEDSIYFVVNNEIVSRPTVGNEQTGEDQLEPSTFKLHERCDRLAIHRSLPRSLYACSLDAFVDIVDAFSENLLLDETFRVSAIYSMFVPPQYDRTQLRSSDFLMTSSALSLASTSSTNASRPLPILQHLFWGDSVGDIWVHGERFGSDTNLTSTPLSLSREPSNARTRRRYRSCHSPSDEQRGQDFSKSIPDHYSSLPRYIRQLNLKPENSWVFPRKIAPPTSDSFSSTITQESRQGSIISDDVIRQNSIVPAIQPHGNNGSGFEESKETLESVRSGAEEPEEKLESVRSHFTHDELRMIDETDSETMDSYKFLETKTVPSENISHAKIRKNCRLKNGIVKIQLNEEYFGEKNMLKRRISTPFPAKNGERSEISELPPLDQKAKTSKYTSRRFSAFPGVDRGRSASPSFEYYQNRSLRGFPTAANPHRCSQRRYSNFNFLTNLSTPVFISRCKSTKAMAKPDSILVYTGIDKSLYSDIRQRLSSILPLDEITVFNVSIEALRKHPWIEKSTVCVIIASTNELDDVAWEKIQSYFNQNGKVIFVCQNKLLASLTECDSSKEKSSFLRFAFSKDCKKRLKETNKEFAKFLEKKLKMLPKNMQINEKFQSKDDNLRPNFTVVLKKETDSPLFLYMQNSGSLHASVLFSDATTQELIAPTSNLLRDSLQSVGVKVGEIPVPTLSQGVMVAEYDSIIENIAGLRLGEEVGRCPKVLLRRTEIIETEGLPNPTEELLPIEVASRATMSSELFDCEQYFDQLSTNIGQVLLVVDVATTTMDICDSLTHAIPSLPAVVVVANRQISGRGRGGNEFISPIGSALFTFSFTIPKSSRFASNLPIVQHLFCVATVDAARRLSGYSDFPLRIKWPNDLYYERSHKVGGILMTCKTRDDSFLISIGCGLNVSNEKPTVCLNDMLPSDSDNRFKKERLIAEILNRFQYYLNDYESNGSRDFLNKYYEYWLHSQQDVLLSDVNERVTIRGIDEYGYLQVRSRVTPDKLFSIGDDGNTFDMMKGLISHKL